jgi:Leucine-rich repeat (LRR) protein
VNLQYLNLSNAGFVGLIPPHLGNLSNLQSLDLTSDDLQSLDLTSDDLQVENLQWVVGLVSLKHLNMDKVDLSLVTGINWVSALNQLPFLMELHLFSCQLFGQIPSPSSLNFTSLAVLDLSSNNFFSKIPDWLVNISTLQHIDISYNVLYGEIPLGLGYLPNLQELDLSMNILHGRLPSSLGNLTSLTYLNLFSNIIDGDIPSSIGEICNLNILNLSFF